MIKFGMLTDSAIFLTLVSHNTGKQYAALNELVFLMLFVITREPSADGFVSSLYYHKNAYFKLHIGTNNSINQTRQMSSRF